MANLTRFDPFREMMRLDPFRNADDFFKEFSMLPSLRGFEPEPRIRMDVSETEQAYTVKADIPGVKKDDIKISIEGNTVSIRAETKEEKQEKMEGNMMRSERYFGEQYRSFTLPQEVDESKAEAKYQDGVLSLTLPKKAGATSKQITIQ
ncbi:Hsp20/alpha crystallin family protein [Noviherbaspirillum sp. UKPF54]|uniref:Hsp20/alpha crystallin family protein n=1 Tax=Noviherbaspirillum sp. UKPF54 TaxID=2601898 RepID=UPI0011B10AAC|nr:Hsp20/alpha crystallin family protein [Noviherbaspirillum sp. UKPF54]QDZ27185.1 Hsp20/alpha crystallin family protein [Noviherbaspirillum sp. UKPF54]